MSALSSEISDDPLARGYSGMTDQQVADSLNAIDRPDVVPSLDVLRYLALVGKWADIKDASLNETVNVDRRKCAINFVDMTKFFEDFDLQDPLNLIAITAQLDTMMTYSFIDATDKATILALENNKRSRAQELGLNIVKLGQVTEARA